MTVLGEGGSPLIREGNRGGFEGDDLSEGGVIIRGTTLERTRGSLQGRAV